MSRSWTLAPLALVLALVAGCEPDTVEDEQEIEPAPLIQPEVAPGEVGMESPAGYEVAMMSDFTAAEGAEPGQEIGGVARVMVAEQAADSFLLHVRVNGLTEGGHAWHIHSGPCGQKAPVVVPFTPTASQQGLAQPLTPGAGGAAEQTVSVPNSMLSAAQLRDGEYSVHVHVDPGADHGPTVACATL